MTSIDQNLVNAWSTGGRPLLAKEPKVAGGQRLTEPQVMTASDKEVRMRCAACRDGYWYLRSTSTTWGTFLAG